MAVKKGRLKGCSNGCREYAVVLIVLVVLFIGGILPSLINFQSNIVKVDESEVNVTPITDNDVTSLKDKMSASGLVGLSNDLNGDTYLANTQVLTDNLTLTGNELAVFINSVLFNDALKIGELNITTTDKIMLELKLKVDIQKIINLSFIGIDYMYSNLTFELKEIDGVFVALSPVSYFYGYKESNTNDILSAESQAQIITTLLNGADDMRSIKDSLGASTILFENNTINFYI